MRTELGRARAGQVAALLRGRIDEPLVIDSLALCLKEELTRPSPDPHKPS
jgi:hypothetical protein